MEITSIVMLISIAIAACVSIWIVIRLEDDYRRDVEDNWPKLEQHDCSKPYCPWDKLNDNNERD